MNLWCNHTITLLFLTNWAVRSWKPQHDRDSSFNFLATPRLNIVKLTEQDVTWAVTRAVYAAVQFRYFFEHFQLHRLQNVEQQDKPRNLHCEGRWGKRSRTISRHFYLAGAGSICFSEMLAIYLRCHRLQVQSVLIVKTSNLVCYSRICLDRLRETVIFLARNSRYLRRFGYCLQSSEA